jgi:hypothetical protein
MNENVSNVPPTIMKSYAASIPKNTLKPQIATRMLSQQNRNCALCPSAAIYRIDSAQQLRLLSGPSTASRDALQSRDPAIDPPASCPRWSLLLRMTVLRWLSIESPSAGYMHCTLEIHQVKLAPRSATCFQNATVNLVANQHPQTLLSRSLY